MSTEILFQELKHIFDTHAILCDEPMATTPPSTLVDQQITWFVPRTPMKYMEQLKQQRKHPCLGGLLVAEVTCLYPMKAFGVL